MKVTKHIYPDICPIFMEPITEDFMSHHDRDNNYWIKEVGSTGYFIVPKETIAQEIFGLFPVELEERTTDEQQTIQRA